MAGVEDGGESSVRAGRWPLPSPLGPPFLGLPLPGGVFCGVSGLELSTADFVDCVTGTSTAVFVGRITVVVELVTTVTVVVRTTGGGLVDEGVTLMLPVDIADLLLDNSSDEDELSTGRILGS